jgi:threonine/homoserine/homoserine lactone efflux protein
MTATLLRGALIGFCLAAPVGPIGLLCIQRTLQNGRSYGLVTGLGAATADALYGVAAGFGLAAAQRFLVAHAFTLRLAGGAFLLCLGMQALLQKAPPHSEAAPAGGRLSAYGTTLALTLSNPMTILSFAAMISGSLPPSMHSPAALALFVLGVFLGSASWWLMLSGLVGAFRALLMARLRWVNVAAGLAIVAFAVASLWSAAQG